MFNMSYQHTNASQLIHDCKVIEDIFLVVTMVRLSSNTL